MEYIKPVDGVTADFGRYDQIYEPEDNYTPAESLDDVILKFDEFKFLSLPERERVLDIIKERDIVLLYGWRGSGKTWFAMSLMNAIATGTKFGPWSVLKPVRCLYLDGEMAIDEMQRRSAAINKGGKVIEPYWLYSGHYTTYRAFPHPDLESPKWRDEILDFMIRKKIKLWFIDNISSISLEAEKNAESWAPINRWLVDLRHYNISTIILHHMGKNRVSGQATGRGTSKMEDNADLCIALDQPAKYTADMGCCFDMRFTKSRLKQSEMELIKPYFFTLEGDADKGDLMWTWKPSELETKKKVAELLSQGWSGKDIANQLEITGGRVSQIRKQLAAEGKAKK
jgi:hypothetical protein